MGYVHPLRRCSFPVLHIVLAPSLQRQFRKHICAIIPMEAGVRLSFFFPPHATLVSGCTLDADGCGMGGLPLAHIGTWQERSVRV